MACSLFSVIILIKCWHSVMVKGGMACEKNAVVFNPFTELPECLMEFCKVTLTFESMDEIL